MDDAMARAKQTVRGLGLDIQITVPGHLPRYEFVGGLPSDIRQGAAFPTEGRWLAVMFPGLDTGYKPRNDEAIRFLRDAGLADQV